MKTHPDSTRQEESDSEEVPMPPEAPEDTDDSNKDNEMDGSRMKVVPKIKRIPWYRWIYMTIIVALPTVIYVLYFTAMGWGETTFNYVYANFGEYSSIVLGATGAFFLGLYMLDANFWTNKFITSVCSMMLLGGIVTSVLFLTADYPFGPICLFASLTPLYLLTVIQLGRRGATMNNRTKDYVTSLSGPLFFVSMITMILFIAWTFLDPAHSYNQVTVVTFSQAAGCLPNLEEYPECGKDYVAPSPPPSLVPIMPSLAAPASAPSTRTRRSLHGVFPNGTISYHENNPLPPTQTYYSQQFVNSIMYQDQLNDANVFTQAETGLCFDTVISPPAWTLDEGCDPDCPKNVYSDCPNALILWAGPLMASMVLFFLSFFCTFLKGNDAEQDIINFGKLWLFLLFTVWITASLAGMGAGISTLLISMTLASFVGAIFFVAMTRTKDESKEAAWDLWARFEEKCGGYLNIGRGIFLVFCSPLLMVYFAMAVVNQAVRKIGLPCSKVIKSDAERADFLTKRARAQINDIRTWERTKVLIYGVYVGLTYMIMSVVITKFTYLLLTVLVEAVRELKLWIVTLILIAFGLTFFLNPFLPGPPVYMTNGLILFVTGAKVMGEAGALIYGVVLSVIVKLMACAMQQKGIGENLANFVAVRKIVGINSGLIKASKIILSKPGISVDKVSILVGGPDWPTSVLCGILHLDLLPILIGTLPVVVICAPTSLMGAFLYMGDQKDEETGNLLYPYASSLSAVATAISALVMMAAPVMAAYYLEQTMTERAKEIEAMPNDKEVQDLEEAEEAYNKCYDNVTKWAVLPVWARFMLYTAFFLMVASVYIVLLFAKTTFAPYTLTSTIEKDLDGEWTNLVMVNGWISIALFMTSWGMVIVFGQWAGAKAKAALAESQ